jgi:hypothetical protein
MQKWNFRFIFLHCDTLLIDLYGSRRWKKTKNGCHAQEAEALSNAATNLIFGARHLTQRRSGFKH